MQKINFIIDKNTFIKFKTICVEKQKTMTEVLNDLIAEYIKNNEKIQDS
jgi:hypothetical protein